MRIPALKLPIKRGALLAAANWPIVVLQFIAEATFKILLAVPIVGGTFLVALALNQDVQEVLGDDLDLRASATGVATSLLEHPVALASFLAALGVVIVGGSALMFILKGGTLAVLVDAQRHAGPLERYPVRLAFLRRASRTDMDVFLAGSRRLRRRFLRLGAFLLATYFASGVLYLGVIVAGYRAVGEEGFLVGWTVIAALCSALLVAWLAVVNAGYLVLQVIMASRDVSVRAAAREAVCLVRTDTSRTLGVFLATAGLVGVATLASIVATAGLGLISFVPFVGLAVLPLQMLAWLLRGLVFQYLGLASAGAYLFLCEATADAPEASAVPGGAGMIPVESLFSRVGAQLAGSAIRQMGILAAGRPDLISFAPGYPDPATFAWPAYHAIVDDLLRRDDEDTLQYGQTRGYGPLIDAVVPRLAARGISCTSDEIVLTTGSQQAVDLVTRLFVDPGDVVLVELPTFTGAIAAFRAAEAELVGVRQDDDGLDLDHLDAMLAAQRRAGRRVKFLYVIPNFQNPTGGLLSQARRRALLEWSLREGVLIVEDDPYGELWFADVTRPEATRPIKADDTEGHVVYVQSTSKTLAPTFRTAWVVASGPIIARLDVAKQSADLCSSSLDQRIVHEAIVRGVLDDQLPRLREAYAHRRDAMSLALSTRAADLVRWTPPRGGFFLWGHLPDGLDTRELLPHAVAAQVIYVPGAPFFVDGTGSNTLRLAFSAASPSRIEEGIVRLAGVIRTAVEGSVPPARPAGR